MVSHKQVRSSRIINQSKASVLLIQGISVSIVKVLSINSNASDRASVLIIQGISVFSSQGAVSSAIVLLIQGIGVIDSRIRHYHSKANVLRNQCHQ